MTWTQTLRTQRRTAYGTTYGLCIQALAALTQVIAVAQAISKARAPVVAQSETAPSPVFALAMWRRRRVNATAEIALAILPASVIAAAPTPRPGALRCPLSLG